MVARFAGDLAAGCTGARSGGMGTSQGPMSVFQVFGGQSRADIWGLGLLAY